ncbi:BtpA/SgcQ family protein [uncultured Gemmiger sp.]|uniref:BtpA/SgcQ family protein n=1 Tax=uncultured Gemmiger sp. TaxID=1623490 RepID=UPI0025CFA7E5|nr:BtpA/SgcQ family protein [uncultured Gemmiger sp.]
MSFLKEMFRTEKPIIGLLHLKPLPGDPFYAPDGSMEKVIACARADLEALQKGGVDGVLVTNELSLPYEKKVSGVTLAAMGVVIGALRRELRVPFGAEAIYDGDATIELCAATGAAFTRCLFTGAWVGDLGLVDRDVARTLRRKSALRLDGLKLFYFVTSEGEVYLNDRTAPEIAQSMLFNCRPDALVVGGAAAGVGPGGELLEQVRAAAGRVPVVCGTGCRRETVAQILKNCDGAFVGTTFKKDGVFENPVDERRVKEFMDAVKEMRGDA